MNIDGACQCGAIAYEATIDPANVSICHCMDCQTFTGSAFRTTVIVPKPDAIRLTRGAPKTYVKTADNGNRSTQHFCGDCGSPLFFSSADNPAGEWGIRWGGITQRKALTPQRAIWCASAVPWLGDIDGLPGRQGD